ncbi:hypothetical protein D3C76_1673470 [compost metagenome]
MISILNCRKYVRGISIILRRLLIRELSVIGTMRLTKAIQPNNSLICKRVFMKGNASTLINVSGL